jgi:hypothetical protein
MTQPVATRDEVLEMLDGLLAGSVTRESVASWAIARHSEQHPDPDVEEALDVLALIDARHGPGLNYLFDYREVDSARASLSTE